MRTFLLKKDIIRVMGIIEKEDREKRTERPHRPNKAMAEVCL